MRSGGLHVPCRVLSPFRTGRGRTASSTAGATLTTTEATPQRNVAYGSITELRDAVEAAGHKCIGWAGSP